MSRVLPALIPVSPRLSLVSAWRVSGFPSAACPDQGLLRVPCSSHVHRVCPSPLWALSLLLDGFSDSFWGSW